MWLMSTFENENLKIIFFVSTFLDWYNYVWVNGEYQYNKDLFFSVMILYERG